MFRDLRYPGIPTRRFHESDPLEAQRPHEALDGEGLFQGVQVFAAGSLHGQHENLLEEGVEFDLAKRPADEELGC